MSLSHCTTEQFDFDRRESDMAQLFTRGCEQLGLTLSTTAQQQLFDHLVLLERWNKRLNLTAIVSPREAIIQHLLDSLAIAKLVKGQYIMDIGSGGGFPGIPLAVIFPEKKITLLDSRGKRVEFLRHASATIGLKNVTAVKTRVQDFRPTEKFDTLVTRAFSSLSDMLAWTHHLQFPGARLLAMKGKWPNQEIEPLQTSFKSRLRVESVKVPFLDAERHVVIIDS